MVFISPSKNRFKGVKTLAAEVTMKSRSAAPSLYWVAPTFNKAPPETHYSLTKQPFLVGN